MRKHSKRRAGKRDTSAGSARPARTRASDSASVAGSAGSHSALPVARVGSAYHHGDLRQALLDAAYAYVDAQDADSLSLAGLAKALGVSQPAPYRHFADRSALLEAVATQGFREFAARLEDAAKAGPQRTALSRMGHAYVNFGTGRAGVYRLMFASPVLRESNSTELGEAARASFALLVDALPRRRTRERRAVHIWAALHGIVMLLNQGLLKDGLTAVSLQDLVEEILAAG